MKLFLMILLVEVGISPGLISAGTPVVCSVPKNAQGSIGPNGYRTELISKNPTCTPNNLSPRNWYKGIQVMGNCNRITRGTAIAIFLPGETRYNAKANVKRSAAIFIKCGRNQIVAIEQTVKNGRHSITLPYNGISGFRDGSKYYVVNAGGPASGASGSNGGTRTNNPVRINPKGPSGVAQGIQIPREWFTFFWRETDVFSQWHPSTFTGIPLFSENTPYFKSFTFDNAEKWMMLCKALLFDDYVTADKILAARTPQGVKAMGKLVNPFDKDIWERRVVDVIYAGNYLKFTQNPPMYAALVATKGTTLVESSPVDKMYGIGHEAKAIQAKFRSQWDGKNILGQTLTLLRQHLTGLP